MALIEGTDRSETREGTNSGDDIYGFGGNDALYGFRGDDDIFGGAGSDDLYGGYGSNILNGGSGEDFFIVQARSLSYSSRNHIEDFTFSEDDALDVSAWGISDFSQLDALLGSDRNGDATFNAYYNGLNNIVTLEDKEADELESSDFVFSDARASEISGTSRADTLFGSRSSDLIEGGSGNDQLLGGLGNDRIYGDGGNDKIFGGRGIDTMTGGSGLDTFIFSSASDSLPGGGSRDRIMDFARGVDFIDVSDIDALPRAGGDQEFEWIGTARFDGTGQLNYVWTSSQTIVQGNLDSDSAAEFQIALDGRLRLTDDDFIL